LHLRMVRDAAEAQYGENPDFYDGFFVPERARWKHLQDKLSDATEAYVVDYIGVLHRRADRLDKAAVHFVRDDAGERRFSQSR